MVVNLILALFVSTVSLSGWRGETVSFQAERRNDGAALWTDAVADPSVDRDFRNPPMEARSRSWWHWQDGFLNAEQMEREIAFMREGGLGGLQQFVAGWTRIPTNGEHLVRFMSDEWLGFSRRALKAASDNGLEYGFQNGAGWTGVGGPWMTTEKSMKHVFAVERRTRGGAKVVLPPLGDGQYAASPMRSDWRAPWYGDIRSFAFPTPAACAGADLPRPAVTSVPAVPAAEGLLSRASFSCHDLGRHPPAYEYDAQGAAESPVLRFAWDAPVTVRAVWLKGVFDTDAAEVWASDDGRDYRRVAELSSGYSLYQDEYAGRWHAVPRTACRAIELRWKRPCRLRIYEAGFTSRPMLTGFEDQCGRTTWQPFRREPPIEEKGVCLDSKDVLDVTDRIAADGTLAFTPPDGREWTVLRIAATSTRRSNQPTNPDMSGPACDVLDADAIRFHLTQYADRMLAAEKSVGAHTVGNVLLDSWEQGTANWTGRMPEEFRRRRGYDLAKYLPVFAAASTDPSTPSLVLKLGRVEQLCEVLVNGVSRGVAWCEPYEVKLPTPDKLDSRGRLSPKSATFDLELRVVNAWHNRLLADQKRPASERKTFTTRPPKPDEKPIASGLIGPLAFAWR